MIRLTITLCVALWAGFVIFGETPEAATQAKSDTNDATVVIKPEVTVAATTEEFEEPTIVAGVDKTITDDSTAEVTRATVTQTASVSSAIAAVPRLVGEPVLVSLINAEDPVAENGNSVSALSQRFRVTGSRVNVRGGPSTSNTVLGSVRQGDVVEEMTAAENGWIEIRNIETGLTGFMAARFLEKL